MYQILNENNNQLEQMKVKGTNKLTFKMSIILGKIILRIGLIKIKRQLLINIIIFLLTYDNNF